MTDSLSIESKTVSYIESQIANPTKFRADVCEFTSKLFPKLLAHIGKQNTPTNAYSVPQMNPFIIKDMPLDVTITSRKSYDNTLSPTTLFLSTVNYAGCWYQFVMKFLSTKIIHHHQML